MATSITAESLKRAGTESAALLRERLLRERHRVVGSAVDKEMHRFVGRRQLEIEDQPVCCWVTSPPAGKGKRQVIAAKRRGQIRILIEGERPSVVVNQEIELFQQVLAENTHPGLSQPADLAGIDALDFKAVNRPVGVAPKA
jgi:hypothetical protein